MALTQQQLDAFIAGNGVNFGLPTDPGQTSANGVFFENVFFQTATGDVNSTPQGLASLTVLNDIGNYQRDDTSFVARNATVTVGDDFGTTFGADSILSISGPSATLNMLGQFGNSTRLRMASENGNTTSATTFISDGAQVIIDNPDSNAGRGIQVGVSFEAFNNNGVLSPGGQSVDATLLIEGANTQVSVVNSTGGNQGSLEIAQIFDGALPDPTTNRSAEGLVIVRDGAELNVRQFIGIADTNGIAGSTAEGALIVEGAGTQVTVGNENRTGDSGFMRVAEEGGTGFFVVRDGAEFNLLRGDGGAGIQFSGSTDRVGGDATGLITGAGTRLFVEDGSIDVGRNIGTASLTISDGATVETRRLSTAQAGVAETIIEGEDTRLILSDGESGSLDVGFLDNQSNSIPSIEGTVIIRDGAQVDVRNFVGVGRGNDDFIANATLIVEGEDTIVTVGSEDRTGRDGFMRISEENADGTFILRDGAEFHLLAGDEFGGGIELSGSGDRDNNGGTASALITGAGTHLVAEQGSIAVGRNGGTSTFTISDGAIVDTLFFNSGRSGNGNTIIEGEGTQLNLFGEQVQNPEFAAFLTVGRDANGSVTVRDGADVTITGDGATFPGFQAGRNVGGTGVITVTGVGSTITVDGANNVDVDGGETGFIRAGRDDGSEGAINVLAGGVVTNDAEGILIVAQENGSTGTVNVDGAGSVFDFGATAVLSEDAPTARGNAVVTISNGGVLRGDEVINNGILDITSGGQLNADLIQDNILRSSSGIEEVTIDGDLTVLTGGFDFEFNNSGNIFTHDAYSVTGDVDLQGTVFVLGSSLAELDGLDAELISGAGLTVSDEFNVQFVEFDAAAISEVDLPALMAASNQSVDLAFVATTDSLIVDFGGNGVFGASGADVVNGTDSSELINGLAGADTISAGDGNDTVFGGNGQDQIFLNAGNDIFNDNDQADQFGADTVFGGNGNDTINGGGGADEFRGGDGTDSISGGAGFDLIFGGNQADTVLAGDGDDMVFGGNGDDSLLGGNGNDTLYDGLGNDSLFGGTGNDLWVPGSGEDTFNGGDGFDTVLFELATSTAQSFELETNLATGDSGAVGVSQLRDVLINVEAVEVIGDLNITVTGNDVANLIHADLGTDNLIGGLGNDTLMAGAGNDTLVGNQGVDLILGENGDDLIDAGLDADSVLGGNGNDTIFGGGGFDTLRGGNGDDTVVGGDGQDSVFLGGGDDLFVDNTQGGPNGADTVLANGGNDTVGGGAGNDRFEGQDGNDLLLGRLGNDVLFGGNQNDTLEGGDGNDTVAGGNGADRAFLGNGDDRWFDNTQEQFGNDFVVGGNGNDWIQAGGGDDTLAGGGGADTFVLAPNINDDVITDYDVGVDDLDINAGLWNGALTQGRLNALTSVQNGNLVFEFDNGDSLTLNGVSSTAGLLGDIELL